MQAFRNIELRATPNDWRLFMIRRADTRFLEFQKKVHARDEYTCQFCGFKARECMESVNINGNYLENKLNNLATACGFCAQCFFLEAVGKSDFGGGVLIFLPEMSQQELNALCHTLFASQIYRLKTAVNAKSIYRSLKLRAQLIEEKLGEGLSNPARFGQMLIDVSQEKKKELQSLLQGSIRLLPNIASFADELATWARAGLAA